ncbi:hypothetical protein BH23ACT11_BH23ACT11_04240 [soil metagenome]
MHYFYSSLTRISPLRDIAWTSEERLRQTWTTGDFVLCEAQVGGFDHLELDNGRIATLVTGDVFIGALGDREATLEATGQWKKVGDDGVLDVLTGAGLLGKMTSKSPFLPSLMQARYRGHIIDGGEKATMRRYVEPRNKVDFTTPTILLVGTSMSSGKTTAGQAIVRRLKASGRSVVSAKLAGAGRYRDILHMADAGADAICDFVDGGLPSTVAEEREYRPALSHILSLTQAANADVAVIEIGASPLADYNGMVALDAVRAAVRLTVLAATDVYAVRGFQQLVDVKPDLVVGPVANTSAGVRLVAEHTGLTALNLSDAANEGALDRLLHEALSSAR